MSRSHTWYVSYLEAGCDTASHLRQCVTGIATGVTLEVALIQFQKSLTQEGRKFPIRVS